MLRTQTVYQKWEERVILALVVAMGSTFIEQYGARYMANAVIRDTESVIVALELTSEETEIAVCAVQYIEYRLETIYLTGQAAYLIKNYKQSDYSKDPILTRARFLSECRSKAPVENPEPPVENPEHGQGTLEK